MGSMVSWLSLFQTNLSAHSQDSGRPLHITRLDPQNRPELAGAGVTHSSRPKPTIRSVIITTAAVKTTNTTEIAAIVGSDVYSMYV
jgi:hypothetical protein